MSGASWNLRQRLPALALCLVVAYAARTAGAAGPSEDDLIEARKAFYEAVAREEANDLLGALERYERARSLAVSPQLLFNMAAVQEKLQRLTAAMKTFELTRDEAARAGNAEVEALAKTRLAYLAKTAPRIVLRLGPSAAGAVVRLDDEVLDDPALATARYVDPGPHRLVARREGEELSFDLAFEAQPSSERVIEVEIAARPLPTPTTNDRTPWPAAPPQKGRWTPVFIAGGATLATGVAAVATGLAGHAKRERYLELNATASPDTSAEREALRDSGGDLFVANAVFTGVTIGGLAITSVLLVRALIMGTPSRVVVTPASARGGAEVGVVGSW